MSQFTLSFLAAMMSCGNGVYRIKTPFWPEVDGLVRSSDEMFDRMKMFMDDVVRNKFFLSDPPPIPSLLFERQAASFFCTVEENDNQSDSAADTGPAAPPHLIRPVSVLCPVAVKCRQKEFVNVRFDVFVAPSEKKRFVWVPLLDQIFTIPPDGTGETPIIDEIKRILARENLEEKPWFLDSALSIEETLGYAFHFSIPLDAPPTPTNTESFLKSCSFREFDPSLSGNIVGFERELELLNESLNQTIPQSVLLIGEAGSGKTALWQKFAVEALNAGIFKSCWEIDAITLAAGHDPRGQIERLGIWAADENVLFHFGNLWEIDQTGKALGQNQSLADALIPLIKRGTLPAVVECDSEQYAELDRNHPSVLSPFSIVAVSEPPLDQRRLLLERMNDSLADGRVTEGGLARLESLLIRYAAYEAFPGAASTFLERLALRHSENDAPIDEKNVTDYFSEQSGLPLFLLDSTVPLDREATRRFFTERVMGQGGEDSDDASPDDPGAIPILLDLIETIKTRMTKADGPIASLMFVGPTGVGKTELAKTLAEFLYGNSKRMVRIDMSEYAQFGAADRLINGAQSGEGILTAAVRAQPFGVVLFDEFEKAHESVFDLLLQILGEGRLTDVRGRTADFRNSVVILTSNLGTEQFGRKSAGFAGSSQKRSARQHFTAEVARHVRPELLNRIDRIVPFRPLSPKTLRRILDRELTHLKRRQGIRARPLTLNFDAAVKNELVRLGSDPRYGARPLRRTLEREILRPLAEALADFPMNRPIEAHFTLEDKKFRLNIVRAKNEREQKNAALQKDADERKINTIGLLRHAIHRIQTDNIVNDFRSTAVLHRRERDRQEKAQANYSGEGWKFYQSRQKSEKDLENTASAKYRRLTGLLNRIDGAAEELRESEAAAVGAWLAEKPFEIDADCFTAEIREILRDLYTEKDELPPTTTFWFASPSLVLLLFYARLFDRYCLSQKIAASFWYERAAPGGKLAPDSPERLTPELYFPHGIYYDKTWQAKWVKSARRVEAASKNGRYAPDEIMHFLSFWPMYRTEEGNLIWPKTFQDERPVHAIVISGIDSPFEQRIFHSLCGLHRATYKNVKRELIVEPWKEDGTEEAPLFDLFDPLSGSEEPRITWKFSGINRNGVFPPWKKSAGRRLDIENSVFMEFDNEPELLEKLLRQNCIDWMMSIVGTESAGMILRR